MITSGSVLLDSSIVIAHFRQDDRVTQKLLDAPALYLGTVALGELQYGARKSANPARKLAQLNAFLPWVTVLPINEATAEYYGQIQVDLARAGLRFLKMTFGLQRLPVNITSQWRLGMLISDVHPDSMFCTGY